ncbi:MAG: hypothetical protein SFZ03_02530 [Candidatus Melainabacteria bacterium]|nr:hypothetical protein [Candidatus Melainabacteria bacterium]
MTLPVSVSSLNSTRFASWKQVLLAKPDGTNVPAGSEYLERNPQGFARDAVTAHVRVDSFTEGEPPGLFPVQSLVEDPDMGEERVVSATGQQANRVIEKFIRLFRPDTPDLEAKLEPLKETLTDAIAFQRKLTRNPMMSQQQAVEAQKDYGDLMTQFGKTLEQDFGISSLDRAFKLSPDTLKAAMAQTLAEDQQHPADLPTLVIPEHPTQTLPIMFPDPEDWLAEGTPGEIVADPVSMQRVFQASQLIADFRGLYAQVQEELQFIESLRSGGVMHTLRKSFEQLLRHDNDEPKPPTSL